MQDQNKREGNGKTCRRLSKKNIENKMEKEKCEEYKEEKITGSEENDKVIKLLFSFVSTLMQLRNHTD